MGNLGKAVGVGLAAGVVGGIAAMAIDWVGSGGMAWYYATSWLWKPFGTEFLVYSWANHLLMGVLMALVFISVQRGLAFKGAKRGAWLGYLIWLVGSLPGMIMTWVSMAVPDPLIASWALGGMVSYVLTGAVVGMALSEGQGAVSVAARSVRKRGRGRRGR